MTSWFEMTLRFLINRTGWLVIGTLYGAMVGQAVGIVGLKRRLVPSHYLGEEVILASITVGALFGLITGAFFDFKFRQTEDGAPHRRMKMIAREIAFIALPIVFIMCQFLLAALLSPVRE
jgi:hypothetical protein